MSFIQTVLAIVRRHHIAQCGRQSMTRGAEAYLSNKSETRLDGAAGHPPCQRRRRRGEVRMAVDSHGDVHQGSLAHNGMSGSVHPWFYKRGSIKATGSVAIAQCAVDGCAIRMRRGSLLRRHRPLAPHDPRWPATTRRRVTSELFLFVIIYKGLIAVTCVEAFNVVTRVVTMV